MCNVCERDLPAGSIVFSCIDCNWDGCGQVSPPCVCVCVCVLSLRRYICMQLIRVSLVQIAYIYIYIYIYIHTYIHTYVVHADSFFNHAA
jgi:hypothetical protein